MLTQADLDDGSVYNKAEACGMSPLDTEACDDDTETVTVPQDPAINLVKSGVFNDEDGQASELTTDGDGFAQAGEIVTYAFSVRNTGNVTLTEVTVSDPLAGLSAITCVPAQGSALAPNATMACTASYVLTQCGLTR